MKATNKNLFLLILGFIFLLIFPSCTEDPITNSVKTPGSLVLTATTSTYNGQYAPSHVLAIWIESSTGTFVKSLQVNAASRKQYLTNWYKSTSSGNTTDAITGATLSKHGTSNCTWNGKDKSGNDVGDGIYKLCIEFTENNGTGKFVSFTFNKGTVVDTQTPAAKSGISIGTLKWTPN